MHITYLYKYWVPIVASLITLVCICCILWFVGNWLIVSNPLPGKIDVIFTFGGESARDLYTAELMKKYAEVDWIISSHIKKNDYVDRYWASNNNTRAFFVDTCSDTRSEILFLKEWLDKNKKGEKLTVGLVSGPYHMRRISVLVHLHVKNTQASFNYFPVPNLYYGDMFDRQHFSYWWKDKLLRFELIKIVRELIR